MTVVIAGDRALEMRKKITQDRFSGTYIGITLFWARRKKQTGACTRRRQHRITIPALSNYN
jgi:hypothetical protein